ncbi:MAG: hypothetical protein FJ104_09515 [Deltaproteobacteria bacterium]|nr:hypothetical protein [Deltaproteobacteria bacterium]
MSTARRPRPGVTLLPARLCALLVSLGIWLAWVSPAAAYPFMLKHGHSQCGSCHTDPMGGETLTGMGRAASDALLSTRWDGGDAPRSVAELFFGVEEPRALRVGGSVRYMTGLYKFPKDGAKGEFNHFPMQADTYGQATVGPVRFGGSLGYTRVPVGSPHAQAAFVTSNQDGERPSNLVSRTHFVGVDVAEGMLLRAGRINLPFGIRMPEHVMWVREATRTDRESDQQHGVAFSYARGKLRGEVMAIAGNYQVRPDEFRERGYALHGEYQLADRLGVGLSSLLTRAELDRVLGSPDPVVRQAHGVTLRAAPLRDLVLLAEADALLTTGLGAGYVGMLQADYEVLRGLHGMVTGEIVDAGKPEAVPGGPGAGEPRLGAWASVGWFFFTHFDWRADLVVRQDSPVTFQSQLHYYF